jgi:hypothetical protein
MRNLQFTLSREKLIYFLVLFLLLATRLLVLLNFNFRYTGNDDMIFWQGATDYSKGIFTQPYFYGQNYNPMLEALFAVPLILLHVPHHIALPACSAFISLFPFLFFSATLFKRERVNEAIVFLFIPLALPLEYEMMCSMSRGFVSGLFFTSPLIFALLEPVKKRNWVVLGLSSGLAYIFNPNSLLFTIPVCIYVCFRNFRRLWFYVIFMLSALPPLLLEFLAKRFYVNNPGYNIHSMWELKFSPGRMLSNFGDLDRIFTFFTPVFWNWGWLIIPALALCGIYLWKKDRKMSAALLLTMLVIVLSLGLNKVNDRVNSFLLSSTRMYLAIPMLAGLAFMWLRTHVTFSTAKLNLAMLLLAVSLFGIKSGILKSIIHSNTIKTNYGSVAIKDVEDLKCDCDKLQAVAKEAKAGLIIISPIYVMNTATMEFYNYGCPLLVKDFPPTVLSICERRTWRFMKEKTTVRENVLLLGVSIAAQEKMKEMNFGKMISADPPMALFNNNTLNAEELLKQVNLSYSNP